MDACLSLGVHESIITLGVSPVSIIVDGVVVGLGVGFGLLPGLSESFTTLTFLITPPHPEVDVILGL
jgi:phage-related protein